MGPSGSGKTVIGARLAALHGALFIDADDLHPAASIAKMAAGIPLDDDDRMPWLDDVGRALRERGEVVVACSALARRYRDRIRAQAPDAVFVELEVTPDELARRMAEREHFMPPALLASQLSTLEPLAADEAGVRISAAGAIDDVAADASAALADQSLR
ncbi:gluconokinase [Microbacterium terricola]|nr:gluconokinase [Microbacterium terricola]UYK41567.1 gluconokinase [Microbacterium terricola]